MNCIFYFMYVLYVSYVQWVLSKKQRRYFKRTRSSKIDSKESTSPAYISWPRIEQSMGTRYRVVVPTRQPMASQVQQPYSSRFLAPIDCCKIPTQWHQLPGISRNNLLYSNLSNKIKRILGRSIFNIGLGLAQRILKFLPVSKGWQKQKISFVWFTTV